MNHPTENQRSLFGITIDALRMPEAVKRVQEWVECTESTPCKFVVTPNVDHAVMLRNHQGFQEVYRDADLILADGHPIIWASRLLGQSLPERVPGSDLVPELFAAAEQPLRVFLLGALPGVGRRAAKNIHERFSNVVVCGVYSPPLGFEKSADENEMILGRIALTRPDVVVVGLGAPKQELWVHQHRDQIRAKAALCVGATIDFLAGEKKRAPRWMQKGGIEWLHRMCSEPKRLVKRYAKDAWVFPQLVWQQWRENRRVPSS